MHDTIPAINLKQEIKKKNTAFEKIKERNRSKETKRTKKKKKTSIVMGGMQNLVIKKPPQSHLKVNDVPFHCCQS